jgi:hypothetical protein
MVFSEHTGPIAGLGGARVANEARSSQCATMTEIFSKNEHHMKEKKPDQSVAVAENGIAKGLADKLIQHPANWFNNLFDCK